MAIGQVAAKGEVELNELIAAKGHDAAEGQIAAEVQVAAEGHDAAIYDIVADNADGAVLYSLTKYSAIFADGNEYFGIDEHNNQRRPSNVTRTTIATTPIRNRVWSNVATWSSLKI